MYYGSLVIVELNLCPGDVLAKTTDAFSRIGLPVDEKAFLRRLGKIDFSQYSVAYLCGSAMEVVVDGNL